MDNIIPIVNLEEAGQSIIENCLSKSTIKQYTYKINIFKSYVQENHPQFMEESLNGTKEIKLDQIGIDAIQNFLTKMSYKHDKHGNIIEKSRQAFEHVSGYKSAIRFYYRRRRVLPPEELNAMFRDFFTGYERLIAELKQNGDMKLHEGKQPMNFSGYRYLALKALEQKTDFAQCLFAQLFLVLSWNLIARCASVSGIMFDHLTWSGDAMVVVFPSHKGDQEGKNVLPKHVYANPFSPSICPILSMAVYVFSIAFRSPDRKSYLFGDNKDANEGRFSKWLRTYCSHNRSELLSLGLVIEDIGTHSFRKGVATGLSSMCGGPSPIAIYLRAGWSLGPVQSRYILESGGGDQLCGRAATGLTMTDPSFACLPPHFDIQNTIIGEDEWETILPGFSTNYPQSFLPVLPFLLASLCYHHEFLKCTLHKGHPLRSQPVWTSGVLSRLSDKVLTGCGRNPVSHLYATGIPHHIVIANEMVKLRSELREVKEDIIQRLDSLPSSVTAQIYQNFIIQGAIPVTMNELKSILAEMKTALIDNMRDEMESMKASIRNDANLTVDHTTSLPSFRGIRSMYSKVAFPE